MMKKERAIKIAYHCISSTFIVIALLFSIFFFDNVAQRMLQSLKDLWTSIKYYAVNYVQAFGLENIQKADDVGVVGDAKVASVLIFDNIVCADNDEDFRHVFQL